MKKLFKKLFNLVIIVFILGIVAFGLCAYQGYQMYQNALEENSIKNRIEEIRSKERLCFYW